MKVEHFKLIDDGRGGIIINGKDSKPKEGMTVLVDFSLTFRTPIPGDLCDHIQMLKLFFLQLTGYWEDSLSKFIDTGYRLKDQEQDERYLRAYWLFENTTITGLKAVDEYYIITGKVRNRYGQVIGLATPKVTYETQYSAYSYLADMAQNLVADVEKFVNDRRLRMMEPRQYVLELFKDAEEHDLESIKKMSDEQVLEVQLSDLERKGVLTIGGAVLDETEPAKEGVYSKEVDQANSEPIPEKAMAKPVKSKPDSAKKGKNTVKKDVPAAEKVKPKVKTAEQIAADDF